MVLFQMKELVPDEEVNPVLNQTFPNENFYNSFEKDKVSFIRLKKIKLVDIFIFKKLYFYLIKINRLVTIKKMFKKYGFIHFFLSSSL